MWKSLARTAGFLAYFFITLEMLFMVTPFALYYYSAYAPLLSAPSSFRLLPGCRRFFYLISRQRSYPASAVWSFSSVWSDS